MPNCLIPAILVLCSCYLCPGATQQEAGTSMSIKETGCTSRIELYNGSSETVELAGYSLSDDEDERRKWIIGDVTLEADSYLVVFASGNDVTALPAPPPHPGS